MKKLLLLILSLTLSMAAFASCDLFNGGASGESGSSQSSQQAEKTYTITFEQDGELDVVKTVKEGEALTDVPAPAPKTGYDVIWSVTDFSSITKDMTVRAIATAKKYTITYDVNGGDALSLSTQSVTFDKDVTLAVPTREGYNFVGWNLGTEDGVAVESGKWTIAENVTLVAKWQEQVVVKYTVSFVQDGSTIATKEVVAGGTLTDIPVVTEKTGYTVTWDRTDFTNITENITVTVKETPNTYTITYDTNGGTVTPPTQDVTFDTTPTLAIPTKDNHTFVCWTYEGNAVSGKWTIANDVTLIASWQENQADKVTVSFVQGGATVDTREVEVGSDLTDIPTPAGKKGYTVTWDRTDFTNITENITVTAKETPNEYKVTYDANGGTVTPNEEYIEFDSTPELPVPTKDGYTFTGWTYEGNAVSGKWTIDKDVTLLASWSKNVNYYTIIFRQKDQADVTFTDIAEGTNFTNIPTPIAVTGYKVEWNATELAKLQNVTEAIIVNAVITVKTYEVTVDKNDGSETTTQTIAYNESYSFGKLTRVGYKFKGWTLNGTAISESGTWTYDLEEITVRAQWEPETYTVKLDAKGGSVEWTEKEGFVYGTTFTLPKPTKSGYRFIGWKYNNKLINLNEPWSMTSTSGVIELVAEWEEIDAWTNNY